ncbi:MAG: 5'-3' exonuclease, partial [Ancrocorticia sp.]|uniref:5'-3' exonuclease n=1 Tax=Ancrocorticia sp. TaxID=2593684 RepID=UPI003F9168A6
MNDERILLVDGNSMAFRAFYALRADSFLTSRGQYTNAVYGFINTLLKMMGDYHPTHVAVAFDLPGGTFRTRRFPDYKGGRAKTPEEFKGQIGVIQETLDVLGIAWLTMEDYEADDIVATLSSLASEQGMHSYIASGDKDAYQLVSDSCTLLYPMPRSQMQVLDPAGVEEKTTVTPHQYPDLAALVGEGAAIRPGGPGG